jgi:hypothetical protein
MVLVLTAIRHVAFAWKIPRTCLENSAHLPGKFRALAWKIPRTCLENAAHLPGKFRALAWKIPRTCLENSAKTPCQSRIAISFCRIRKVSHKRPMAATVARQRDFLFRWSIVRDVALPPLCGTVMMSSCATSVSSTWLISLSFTIIGLRPVPRLRPVALLRYPRTPPRELVKSLRATDVGVMRMRIPIRRTSLLTCLTA